MKSLLDPSFKYVPAVETDLRKTFARVRREQRQQAEREAQHRANVEALFQPTKQRKP